MSLYLMMQTLSASLYKRMTLNELFLSPELKSAIN